MSTAETPTLHPETPPGAPLAAGRPFHLLAAGTRWPRLVAGTVVLGVAMAAALVAPMLAVMAIRGGHYGPLPVLGPLTDVLVGLTGVALSLPAALAVTRWIGLRRAGTLFSTTVRLRWRWLGQCALIALPTVAATLIGTAVLAKLTSDTSTAAPDRVLHPPLSGIAGPAQAFLTTAELGVGLAVIVVALAAVQSTAEEVIARGWILQTVGALTGRVWPAVTVQAVIFAVLHGLHGTPWGYVALTAYAIVVGLLAVSTGGIEAGIAYHAVSNGIVGLLTVGLWTVGALGSDADSMADVAWQAMVMRLAGFAVYAAWISHRYRRYADNTTTPPPRVGGEAGDDSRPGRGPVP